MGAFAGVAGFAGAFAGSVGGGGGFADAFAGVAGFAAGVSGSTFGTFVAALAGILFNGINILI
jgi:hypothetical protein